MKVARETRSVLQGRLMSTGVRRTGARDSTFGSGRRIQGRKFPAERPKHSSPSKQSGPGQESGLYPPLPRRFYAFFQHLNSFFESL